jgi:hypothetical protein
MEKSFKSRRIAKNGSEARSDQLALRIGNDIAEGIDAGESRFQLREAIGFFSRIAAEEARLRVLAEARLELFASAKALMDVAIPPRAGNAKASGAANIKRPS